MPLLKDQLQLNAVQQISKNSVPLFEQPEEIEQMIQSLSLCFEVDWLALSTCYFDTYNNELSITTYTLDKASDSPICKEVHKHLISNEQTSSCAYINAIIKACNEVSIDNNVLTQALMNNLQNQNHEHKDSDSQTPAVENYQSLPFHHQHQLVGLITYQADKSLAIEQNYPALFHSFISAFYCLYREKYQSIKLATYQTVLDLMPQRVFWKTKDSVYLGCNQAFAHDANLSSPKNIVGVTDFDIFPAQAELYRSDDANTMTTRQHLIGSEEPQTHQNGNTIWLRTSKRPIISKDDNVIGVVGTYDDISELKNIQQELSIAKEKLEERVELRTQELNNSNNELEVAIKELRSAQNHLVESEKMAALGNLVAGVAHEINTPVGVAVTGASHLTQASESLKEMLEKGVVSKTQFVKRVDELVMGGNIILRNLERASELVRNFKMIAVDQSTDDRREINFHQYLHDVINAMAPRTNKKNVKIFLSGDQHFYMQTFPGAIAQILTNLIDNALNHAFTTKESGQIVIEFNLKAEKLELNFSDNGAGIAKHQIDKIFEPFYTTNRADGGSGLGLSIIYNIVTQRLGGSIHCQSTVGEGTTFTLLMPIS